jgi:hypothetical protein
MLADKSQRKLQTSGKKTPLRKSESLLSWLLAVTNYLQARSMCVHMTLFANHYCVVQMVRTDSKISKGGSKLKYFDMKAAFSFLYTDGNARHLFIIEMLCGATESNF